MLGRGGSWRCGDLGRVGERGECWGRWVSGCEVWVWGRSARGPGLGAMGKGSQAVEQCTGLRGWGGKPWGSAGAQGGPGARQDCGAVGLGMGEELGPWGWSWRKGGSMAVGLGCGEWGCCHTVLATACRVLGRGRHEYRRGRGDCWPHCWAVLNLEGEGAASPFSWWDVCMGGCGAVLWLIFGSSFDPGGSTEGALGAHCRWRCVCRVHCSGTTGNAEDGGCKVWTPSCMGRERCGWKSCCWGWRALGWECMYREGKQWYCGTGNMCIRNVS